MSAAEKVNANRPRAERIVEPSDYYVALDLEPIAAALIQDLAVALKGRGHLFTNLANLSVSDPEHSELRKYIVGTLRDMGAFQVVLGQDQADELASDLWEATSEPAWCVDCGDSYATREHDRCEPCADRTERREGEYAHLRAVGS